MKQKNQKIVHLARTSRHVLTALSVIALLASCSGSGGGGGGGSPVPENAATISGSATVNTNTIAMSGTQTGQIASTIANADGSTQLVTTANSTLGAMLTVGNVVQVTGGADTRFPLGLVGKVDSVTTGSDGVTSAVLTNATLADVVQKSISQGNEIALDSANFIGVISPKAVQASATTPPLTLSALQQGITALNGGLVISEPNLLGRIANTAQSGLSFLGGNGTVDVGEVKLTLGVKLEDMGLDPSRLKPYGLGGASFDIVGSIKNLKLIENHDFDTTAGVTTGLKSMDMRVTGDIDVSVNLHGGVDADLGYFSQAWKEVEDEQMKLLGVSAKLTGLDSKDKIGKYPIAGLVFSVPCPPTGCPVLVGQTQTPLRAAKAGGVIVWVYLTASGKIVLDGEVGARINAAHLNLGLQKSEGGKLDDVHELSNTGKGRLIEAPYFNGEAGATLRLGTAIDVDFFTLGIRIGNASVFTGGQANATLKTTTPISYGTTKLGDPWTWNGQACVQTSIGAGAIFSAAVDVGVKIDTLLKNTSLNFAYGGTWPTEEEILIPGWHGIGNITWYTSTASNQCFPTPAINQISTTQNVSTNSVIITVSGTNLPDDLLLNVSPAANCTGMQKTVTGNTSVSFTCQIVGTVTGLVYNLSSLKAENMDLSAVGSQLNYTVSPFTPTQTAVITQVLDDFGTSTGPLAQDATTDDTTPGLSGTLSAALTATQTLVVYNGSAILGSASVSGTTWSFTPTALAAGNYSFTAAVVSVDGIEGIRSGAWNLTVSVPAAPVVTLTATPSSIANGATSTLSWSSTNSTSCTSSGGGGTGTAGSFITPSLTTTTTYTVTCTGAGGTASQSTTVTVAALAPTSTLNDTGITSTQCYQAGSDVLVDCGSAGAIALNNAQDGMAGRDVTNNSNTDGKLGFSFTGVPAAGTDTGGCVQDNVTGLMWEVKTTDGGLSDWTKIYTNYSATYDPNLLYGTSTDATGFVTAVNATNLCGYSDWRLPSADELQSIVDYSVAYPGPTIDASWFPNTQGYAFWSSSPYVGYSTSAWYVHFYDGYVYGSSRDDSGYVRLVRAGQ